MEAAQYDLIIVGAGPAGSACAITAARTGAKVLLLEKDSFPRQKVCGEFVSPESLGLLHGLLEDGRFRSCPARLLRREYFWTTRRSLFQFHLPRKAFRVSISIPRFLRRAGLLASPHMKALPSKRCSVMKSFHVARIRRHLYRTCCRQCHRTLVKADAIRVTGKDKWLGLKAHFTEQSPPQSVDLYFFPGGYCGVTPVGAIRSMPAPWSAPMSHTPWKMFSSRSRICAAQPRLAAAVLNGNHFSALFPATREPNPMACCSRAMPLGLSIPSPVTESRWPCKAERSPRESIVPFLRGAVRWSKRTGTTRPRTVNASRRHSATLPASARNAAPNGSAARHWYLPVSPEWERCL